MTNETTAPELIWAVTEPDDVSAQILGDVYAQQVPDGMVGEPVEYVRADALEAAQARIAELEGALDRIAMPEAFFVATGHIDPEAFARMWFARLIREGSSVEDANVATEDKVRDRYLPERAALENKG